MQTYMGCLEPGRGFGDFKWNSACTHPSLSKKTFLTAMSMAIHPWKSLWLLCKMMAGLVITDTDTDTDAAGDVPTSLANTNWHSIPHGTEHYPKILQKGEG